jgi:hypothetical protein
VADTDIEVGIDEALGGVIVSVDNQRAEVQVVGAF